MMRLELHELYAPHEEGESVWSVIIGLLFAAIVMTAGAQLSGLIDLREMFL